MEEDASSHVGEGDAAHDDEGADHVALGPGLEHEASWIDGLCDFTLAIGSRQQGMYNMVSSW
jgi:hypothetical protein